MDLDELEAFLTLAEELHFGRTARRLRLSQPRVSRLVASLEREIGGILFERTSRRVKLTPLGNELRGKLAPAYAQMRQAVAAAKTAARSVAGVLRVGYTATTADESLTALLKRFVATHPECALTQSEIPMTDPLTPLRSNQIDVLANWLAVGELGDWRPAELYDLIVPPRTPSGRPIHRTVPTATIAEVQMNVAAGMTVHPTVDTLGHAGWTGRTSPTCRRWNVPTNSSPCSRPG